MKSIRQIVDKMADWEAWPFAMLYSPIAVFWIWYSIRSGSCWFFTSSNPKITFGGLEGEPKKEMYDLLPPGFYPATLYVSPQEDFNELRQKLHQHKINYPFIVKPEIGEQGILLRKIDDVASLRRYHNLMAWDYIIQELVLYPMEVSVFYVRHPAKNKGIVTGFLHKIPLHVTGDGKQTLASLIKAHHKAGKRLDELFNRHKEMWDKVVPAGEKYVLSPAANHNRGASFIDLKDSIDDQLVSIFDKISLEINDFFYGRYDIMCTSVEDLKQGLNFTILEYNGCGAEPNHFYDTGYTLAGAYKEILRHWGMLYEICKYNRKQGVAPWTFNKGRSFIKINRRRTKEMKLLDARI